MGTNAEHDDARRESDLPEPSECPKVLADLLASQSGPRTRVIDEHNFTVPGSFVPGTFRVQIFTGPGLRPVAVATQTDNEGNSLSNDSWEYCAAVWRTLLPEESEPPIWIKRMLLDWIDLPDYQISVLQATGDGYGVVGVCGTLLTADQAAELAGARIAPGRGERFAPLPEPPPTHVLRYRVAWVAALPRTSHRSDDLCMTARGFLSRRLLRQLVPRRTGRECCWYHQGDWHTVSALAVKLLGTARRSGIEDAQFYAWAVDEAAAHDLTEWQTSALKTLLNPAVSIHVGKGGYTNGNHRARAMLDAGVRRTVVTDLEALPPAPTPADPAPDRRWAREERAG
jgi:hypothetical protein